MIFATFFEKVAEIQDGPKMAWGPVAPTPLGAILEPSWSHLINQAINPSIFRPTRNWQACQFQSDNQSINQTINQSIYLSINQSIYQSIKQWIKLPYQACVHRLPKKHCLGSRAGVIFFSPKKTGSAALAARPLNNFTYSQWGSNRWVERGGRERSIFFWDVQW